MAQLDSIALTHVLEQTDSNLEFKLSTCNRVVLKFQFDIIVELPNHRRQH